MAWAYFHIGASRLQVSMKCGVFHWFFFHFFTAGRRDLTLLFLFFITLFTPFVPLRYWISKDTTMHIKICTLSFKRQGKREAWHCRSKLWIDKAKQLDRHTDRLTAWSSDFSCISNQNMHIIGYSNSFYFKIKTRTQHKEGNPDGTGPTTYTAVKCGFRVYCGKSLRTPTRKLLATPVTTDQCWR